LAAWPRRHRTEEADEAAAPQIAIAAAERPIGRWWSWRQTAAKQCCKQAKKFGRESNKKSENIKKKQILLLKRNI
jgi:hypothetical protein